MCPPNPAEDDPLKVPSASVADESAETGTETRVPDATGAEAEEEDGSGSRLGEQSRKLMHDVRELGGMAVDTATEAASKLRSRSADRLHKVQGGLEEHVASHPLQSVLLALGVGALIGMLCLRRD